MSRRPGCATVTSGSAFPSRREEQDVEIAIVVVIGMTGVESENLIIETGLDCSVLKFATPPVDEQGRPLFIPEGSGEDVGEAVAGEVVEDAAAGLVRPPQVRPTSGERCEPAELDVRTRNGRAESRFRLDLDGYSPSVILAMFKSQRTRRSPGHRSRIC